MKKLLLTVLALTAVFCAAEEYPVLSVPEVKSADCAVWRCMNRFNPLAGKEPGETGPEFARAPLWRAINHVAGTYPARVEINYTKDCLVIICSGQVKEVTVGRGDGPYAMFGGCTAEVFLQPDPAGPDFYQFAVSPDNRLYQAKGWDCTWKPAVPLKTAVISGREQGENGKNFWSARMEIPFASLGRGTPEKGETWKANFVFGKSWSPTTDYHDPSQFGTLVFSGREPGRVEVDEFTFRDGAFTLTFTNHGTTAAKVKKLNGSGEESELLPGKTAFWGAKFADRAHKDIHKFGVQVTQDGKTYRFSGLSPAKDPDNAGLKKFYYAPGELVEHPRPGEFRHGTATASVQPEDFFRPVPVPQGKLVLKDGHFEVGGIPYYPVVGAKNAPVKIIGCIGSGFTREPVTGAVFDVDLKIAEHVFEQAEKKNEPTLFRIQYESQLTILQKDRAGKIQIVPDQIAFYETAYRQQKKRHPEALISIQADGAERRKERIARCCDVFEYASWGSSYAPALMEFLEEDLDSLLADADGKPVMFWLGGFKSGGVNRSAEELRAAVFLSMIKGCTGNILHLGHGGLPKDDTHAQDLVAHIRNEVDSFYADFIRGEDATGDYHISGDDSGKGASSVRFAVRRLKNGTDLLIAVNTSASSEHLCLFRRGRSVREGEEIAPYGVRVLRLPGPPALNGKP